MIRRLTQCRRNELLSKAMFHSTAGATSNVLKRSDRELFLENSVLSLDSQSDDQKLSFLSSASVPLKQCPPKIIATEETAKLLALSKKTPKVLTCQYNRPFSLGNLKLELLPSGFVLGGASLYLETNRERILYAPSIQIQKLGIFRQAQAKAADTLILGAHHLPNSGSQQQTRKKQKAAIQEHVSRCLAEELWPTIYCETHSIAPELTQLLSTMEIPLRVHRFIYKVNKLYEASGFTLGKYSQATEKTRAGAVSIFPLNQVRGDGLYQLSTSPGAIIVQDTHESLNIFELDRASDIRNLGEFLDTVKPEKLMFTGPYAKEHIQLAKTFAPSVMPLNSYEQRPLF